MVIGKLRSDATTAAESHHHMKAAKALLVIIPLLGITYLITLIPPPDDLGYLIFQHARAVLLSTQGFVITLPYCFLNTEARTVLKHNWERWKANRLIGNDNNSSRDTHSTRNSISMAERFATRPSQANALANFKLRSGINVGNSASPDPERHPLKQQHQHPVEPVATVATLASASSPSKAGNGSSNGNGSSAVVTNVANERKQNGASPGAANSTNKRHFVRATIHIDDDEKNATSSPLLPPPTNGVSNGSGSEIADVRL